MWALLNCWVFHGIKMQTVGLFLIVCIETSHSTRPCKHQSAGHATCAFQEYRGADVDPIGICGSDSRHRLVDGSEGCTSGTCPIKWKAINSDLVGENVDKQLAFMDECLSAVVET